MSNPPYGPHDDEDHDDLAALDFSAAGDAEGETDLGVILGDYAVAGAPASHESLRLPAGADDDIAMPMFTVTNPPGTVTVTTYMDGRVHQVDLAANVV